MHPIKHVGRFGLFRTNRLLVWAGLVGSGLCFSSLVSLMRET